ncbi:hypothetical protein G3A_20100 [Bacillus sp. 17376]|nr:hypothetical protein G3A_20100 [Bacillus sp. 17376]
MGALQLFAYGVWALFAQNIESGGTSWWKAPENRVIYFR